MVPITNGGVPLCLKLHYMGSCFSKGKFRETHRLATSRQENGLQTLLEKCKALKNLQRSQRGSCRGADSCNMRLPSTDDNRSKNYLQSKLEPKQNFIPKTEKKNVWKSYQHKMRRGVFKRIVVSYLLSWSKNA